MSLASEIFNTVVERREYLSELLEQHVFISLAAHPEIILMDGPARHKSGKISGPKTNGLYLPLAGLLTNFSGI